MANQRRMFRVAEKIRTVIATELLNAADPRLELVTITSVVTSPDLRQAKVYWAVSGGDGRVEEARQGFESAGRRFKRAVASEIQMKFVPELKFFYDNTLDTNDEVERLLAQVGIKSDG